MQRCLTWILAVCLAVGALVSPRSDFAKPAQAQPPDDQLGESLGFVILFPQLRNLPPPAWFVPGVRVSYNSISANFQGGGAGGGVVQYDVVGLGAGWAVASAQSLADNGAGALIPLGSTPKVGLPAVGEFWINPAVLTNAEAVANQNLSVTRLNKVYLGQTRQVVRFQSTTQGGRGRTVWEFNAASGLLLFYSQALDGVTASQLEVIGFRTPNLITQGTTAPNWVRPNTEVNLTGTQTQQILGGGNVVSPYAIGTRVLAATSTWSIQGQNTFLNGIHTGSASTANGVGQIFGGLWLPQQALGRIPNQATLIDQDSITGAQIFVGRANNGEIFVREVAQGYETILFYDPNLGALNGILQTINSVTGSQTLNLRRTSGSDLQQLNSLPPLSGEPSPPQDTIETDLSQEQSLEVDLLLGSLQLVLPANFVSESAQLQVGVVLNPPPPPAGMANLGDTFAVGVNAEDDNAAIAQFDKAVTLRLTLPELATPAAAPAAIANQTPTLYYRAENGWQELDSVYDAEARAVQASHDRAGIFAAFVEEADPVSEQSIFLPTLRR